MRSDRLIPKATLVALSLVSTSCNIAHKFEEIFSVRESQPQLFKAKDGDYFPEFIKTFFPGATKFAGDYPTLSLAKDDIRLIEVRPLSPNSSKRVSESNLSWSADGAYLGYEVVARNKRHIKVKNLVGDYSRELAVLPNRKHDFLDGMLSEGVISYNAGLQWASTSVRYAFMSNGGVGEYNVYVGSIGKGERSVARSPTKDGYATWNPRKNELAFVSARTGKGDIYLITPDDGEISRLTFSDHVDLFPSWFDNGNRIVFSSGGSFNHDLWLVERDADTNRWHKPFPFTAWREDELKPVVSPDGRFVAFYASEGITSSGRPDRWNLIVVPYIEGKTYRQYELERSIVAEDIIVDINSGPAWSPDSQKVFFIKHDAKKFNPIHGYHLFSGRLYEFDTNTKMNRDLMISRLGILSFRAQSGVWDKVYLALTNQGLQLQANKGRQNGRIHYIAR